MMLLARIGLVALLVWAQSDTSKPGIELLGFDMNETPSDVVSRLGRPDSVDDSLPNYISWLFKLGAQDEHDYGFILCFRRSDQKLVSVTRNFEPEAVVDHLFPEGSFVVRHWPSDENPQFSIRVRALSGERLLDAMGSAEEGKPCGQLILIHRTVVPIFFPWLADRIKERPL
jgi:hypothetical protein